MLGKIFRPSICRNLQCVVVDSPRCVRGVSGASGPLGTGAGTVGPEYMYARVARI